MKQLGKLKEFSCQDLDTLIEQSHIIIKFSIVNYNGTVLPQLSGPLGPGPRHVQMIKKFG